jgi:DNA-binding transcriptional ArsR family regulator
MDDTRAIAALGALAQESRLKVFRLLTGRGERGMAAGEIARRLGVPHNTLSTHLGLLSQAGLVRARRDGRSIIYSMDLAGVRALLGFLMQDCCNGRPEVCAPLLDAVAAGCCRPAKARRKPARAA